MGKQDNVTRAYMTNRRFADLINVVVYGGEQVISEDMLKEIDPVTSDITDSLKTTKRERDMIKIAETEENIFILFGIENQTSLDKEMPLRIMEYDAREYRKQLNQGDFIKPVITLVIYWSTKEWTTSRTLHDMMSPQTRALMEKEPYSRFVKDYPINIVEINRMKDQEFDLFKTDLGIVMKFIKLSDDKNMITKEFENSNAELPLDAVDMINAISGSTLPYNEEEEVVVMCKAIEGIREDAKEEGRKEVRKEMSKAIEGIREDAKEEARKEMSKAIEGIREDAKEEGRKEGMARGARETLLKLYSRNLIDYESLAAELKLPEADIQKLITAYKQGEYL